MSRVRFALLAAFLAVAASCAPGEPTDALELQTRLAEDAGLDASTAQCVANELFALAARAEPEDNREFDIAVHGFDIEGDVGRAGSIDEMEENVPGITEVIRTVAADCGA